MTGKRILVVEDQEDLRGVLRDLLAGSGYAVLEAPDGQTAVAAVKSDRPDISSSWTSRCRCLMATRPTRQIKADSALKATPIIAVSSFAMTSPPAVAHHPRLFGRATVGNPSVRFVGPFSSARNCENPFRVGSPTEVAPFRRTARRRD